MPSQSDWLGIFNNALLTMVAPYNYEQIDPSSLTIEETVIAVQAIIDEYWSQSECDTPITPDDTPIVRLDPLGQWEQILRGDWRPPEGDYQVPPVPPRMVGDEEDKRCLAASNAANVLQQLYENVTDSASAGLTTAEAIVEFLIAVLALLGSAINLLVGALLVIAELIFQVLFEVAEFITADVWTNEFNDNVVCALFECASVTDDVVTFNYSCFSNKLAASVDVYTDPYEILLFGQISYLLNFIGIDGLNLAGATTAIASADCDFCDAVWCYLFDGDSTLGDWDAVPWSPGADLATYDGVVWNSALVGSTATIVIDWLLASSVSIFNAAMTEIPETGLDRSIWVNGDGSPFTGTKVWENGAALFGVFPITVTRITVICGQAFNPYPRTVGTITIEGTGVNPFGITNC